MAETPLHQFDLRAKVVLYDGSKAVWHFLTLPKKESAAISHFFGSMKRGWGSLPVMVTIGKTQWKTSIFPDSKAGTYILPLKAEVREKEKLRAGATIRFRLEIRP
jgi:hypothetical protein